jgi:predicted Rossmann fold nucleotide-binding protein DprA/Smf involved in DNA uptake
MKVNVFRESKFSPSRISHSVGVNKLIQDGAHSVMSVKDIIDQLNLFMIPRQVEMQAILPDNAEEKKLLELLSHEPLHIDDLIRESDMPTHDVISVLTMMESKGQFWFKRQLQRDASNSAIAA